MQNPKLKQRQKIRILSYNVAGTKFRFTKVPFVKIQPYIENTDSDIMCFQEMFYVKKKVSEIKMLSGLNSIIPPNNDGCNCENQGQAIITGYELKEKGFFDFSNEGYPVGGVSWATIIIGKQLLRIYNCHLEVMRVGISDRLKMIRKVFQHANKTTLPVVICGDMNTTVPKVGFPRFFERLVHRPPKKSFFVNGKYYKGDERYVFLEEAEKHGYKEVLDMETATWVIPHTKLELPNLKLDWFLIKGVEARLIELGPYISDHRPVLVEVEI